MRSYFYYDVSHNFKQRDGDRLHFWRLSNLDQHTYENTTDNLEHRSHWWNELARTVVDSYYEDFPERKPRFCEGQEYQLIYLWLYKEYHDEPCVCFRISLTKNGHLGKVVMRYGDKYELDR